MDPVYPKDRSRLNFQTLTSCDSNNVVAIKFKNPTLNTLFSKACCNIKMCLVDPLKNENI